MEINGLPVFRINKDGNGQMPIHRLDVNCPNLAPLKKDTVSFKGTVLKKSDFKGSDLAVIERYKPNIQQFKSKEDLQAFAERKIKELFINPEKIKDITTLQQVQSDDLKDFGGRQVETRVQRKAMLKEWFDYVIKENDAYSNTQRLIILSAITKDLKSNNDNIPDVLNKGVLAQTVTDLEERLKVNPKDNFDFHKMYKNNLRVSIMEDSSTGETMTGWVVIPSKTNDPENFEKNVEKLKTLSHNSWCTKSFNAEPYLSEGDFHVYLENGQPKLGVRFVGDKVQEIQGEKNDGKIPQKYLDTFKLHQDNLQIDMTENAKNQVCRADEMREQISQAKKDLGSAIELKNIHDVKKVLNLFNIKAEINENNLLVLDRYKQKNTEMCFDDLDIDENKMFKFIEEIKGNAYFTNSNVVNLGKLKKIGTDVNFSYSKVKDLGDLEVISEDANFSNSQITSLGNLRHIGGSVDFSESKITSLNKLESIGFDVSFFATEIIDLGNLKSIGGTAKFIDSKIKSLGKLENIGESADFTNSEVTDLGELQNIGGWAIFKNAKVTNLGKLQEIGLGAIFDESNIQSLGQLKSIGGDVRFSNSQITDLGELKYIGGRVIATDSNLTYKDFSNIEIQGSFTGNDNVPIYIAKRKNFKSEEYM